MKHLLLLLLFPATAFAADDPSYFEIQGRAYRAINQTVCLNASPSSCYTEAYLSLRRIEGGVVVQTDIYCDSSTAATYCTASGWLGTCAKTTTNFSEPIGVSGSVTGTIVSCNTPTYGNCQHVSGHVNKSNRLQLDYRVQQGGCQY